MNKNTSDVVALVLDTGLFIHVARRLAREFKTVFYWSPWETAFPHFRDDIVGDGYPEIIRVESPEDVEDQIDLAVFPDIGFSGIQKRFIKKGIPVWGCRDADELEARRGKFLEVLKTTSLPVPKHEKIKGETNLRLFLEDHPDQYIKVDTYRGDFETFHFRSMAEDGNILDEMAVKLGPLKENLTFWVFAPIDTEIEDGIDTYCIDGQWPETIVHGMESKDKAYIGAFQKFADCSPETRCVNDAFSPILASYGYRSMFCTEVRITKEGKSFFIDPTCFSDDTEVLTNSGWKLFSALDESEMVATLNPISGHIEYHFPSAFIRRRFDGEMVLISNKEKTIECLVTPDHSVWRTDRNGCGLFSQKASELTDKGFIPRTGKWIGEEVPNYVVPEYKNEWNSGRKLSNTRNCFRPESVVCMDDWLRFLGIYIAEGSLSKWSVCIAQSKFCKEMSDILEALPFTFSKTRHGFQISDAQLRFHIESMGLGLCNQKFVPQFVKFLSPRQIRIFLEAYRLGDGCSERLRYFTTSERLANDVQELVLKCGSVASIKRRNCKGTKIKGLVKEYIRKHDIFIVSESSKQSKFWFETGCRGGKYISKVPYSGFVYDVTVQNHILYVRRNGKPFWSGNCRFPSPPSQCLCEMIGNLGEIIWKGANGILIEPKQTAKFGAQAIFHVDRDHCGVFKIPKEIEQWVKISFSCQSNGLICVPPDPQGIAEIGWCVGIGDTIEESIDHLREVVDQMPSGVNVEFGSLTDLLKELKTAEEAGIELTTQEIPDASTVSE